MNEEKQKFIGGVDFEELRAQRVQLYNTIIIDLATARINEEQVFTGNYIYALEATDVDANLDIRFNELFRAAINVKEGRGIRVPFYRFYITNTAQAGKILTLAIGIEASDFEVFDVGKTLGITGTVDTHVLSDDSESYDTKQKNAFIGGFGFVAGAGNYAHSQLWNPAASGVNLLCRQINVYTQNYIVIRRHNVALVIGGDPAGNKYLGEAAPLGDLRHCENAAFQGTAISTHYIATGGAYGAYTFTFRSAILIPEGLGLVIQAGIAVTTLSVQYEWTEETA